MARITVIGLGVMGAPMARNLKSKGRWVAGVDLNAEAEAAFDAADAPRADRIAEADVVITMLPEGAHVAEAFERWILPSARPGTLMIDCSTIDVGAARDVAAKAAEAGLAMLDAPVSGGPEAAEKGALSFMVGGPEDAFARAAPLFGDMGAKVAHFGPAGAGQAAKACHNMICGITAMAVVEGFALADAMGLDLSKFYALCAGAAAQSWTLENRCPIPGVVANAPSSNGFAPGFAAALMAKDLRLAQAAAERSGQETPFGAEAARRFTAFAEGGGGQSDFSAIYQTLRPLPPAN